MGSMDTRLLDRSHQQYSSKAGSEGGVSDGSLGPVPNRFDDRCHRPYCCGPKLQGSNCTASSSTTLHDAQIERAPEHVAQLIEHNLTVTKPPFYDVIGP